MGRIGFAVKNGVLVIWGCLLHARDYTTPPAFLKTQAHGKKQPKIRQLRFLKAGKVSRMGMNPG